MCSNACAQERNTRILAYKSCREANRVGWKRDWKRKSGSEKQLIKPCLIYNSAFRVNSLINNVWVVYATSSLSNMDQAGADFYEMVTHQPVLIAISWVETEMDGRSRLNRKNFSAHQETAGSWIQVGPTHQDGGRMLLRCYLATRLLPS